MTTPSSQNNSSLSLQVVNPNQPSAMQQQATMQNFQDLQTYISSSGPQLLFQNISSSSQTISSDTWTPLNGFSSTMNVGSGLIDLDASISMGWDTGSATSGIVGLFIDGTLMVSCQSGFAVGTNNIMTSIILTWKGILSSGEHSFQLQAASTAGSATINRVFNSTYPNNSYMFIRQG